MTRGSFAEPDAIDRLLLFCTLLEVFTLVPAICGLLDGCEWTSNARCATAVLLMAALRLHFKPLVEASPSVH